MQFMLLSHGARHVKVRSDDGHDFQFDVVTEGSARQLVVGAPQWRRGSRPNDSSNVVDKASQFATLCAKDLGLA